jgi:hypothetical protein
MGRGYCKQYGVQRLEIPQLQVDERCPFDNAFMIMIYLCLEMSLQPEYYPSPKWEQQLFLSPTIVGLSHPVRRSQ